MVSTLLVHQQIVLLLVVDRGIAQLYWMGLLGNVMERLIHYVGQVHRHVNVFVLVEQ